MIEATPQQRAILEFALGNQVVLAGAGTGKTQTLAGRVLHLLTAGAAGEPCELHQLVALTFTDKAAAEMRQRVYRGLLEARDAATDETLAARLKALRAGFAEHNRIGTFDSFNRSLLALYPEQATVPPGFEPMSDYDRRDLKSRVGRAFWEHAETLEGEARVALFDLLQIYERRQLANLIDQLAAEETATLLRLAQPVDDATLRANVLAWTQEAIARHDRRANRALDEAWRRYVQAVPVGVCAELQAVLLEPEMVRPGSVAVLTGDGKFRQSFLKSYDAAECELVAQTALPLLRRWRELHDKAAQTRQALAIDAANLDLSSDRQSQEIVRRLAGFALWWQEKRAAVCWANRWVDFTGMHRAALSLLREQATIGAKLRSGFRHILIDEFQDTNIEQWRLIEAFQSGDNVFIMGDGKQAIYRFRGGDITVFNEVQRHLIQEAEPHPLNYSFRPAATPQHRPDAHVH